MMERFERRPGTGHPVRRDRAEGGQRWTPSAALAACMLLAACSDAGDLPATEPSTVTAAPTGHQDLPALARSLGIEDPPDVPVVQEISAEEHIPMLESCMTEAGFPPVNPGRASLEWEPAEEQQEAFHRAYYTCSAQYPIAGEFQPYDGEQLGAVYDHWVEETIPCLAALGYVTSGMPSREAFIGGAVWDPRESTYQDVMRDVSNGRWIDEEDVYTTQCPTSPDL